jgi:hypothetical protein
MRKSCAQATYKSVHSLRVTMRVILSQPSAPNRPAYNQLAYTPSRAQVSSAIYGTYEQLLQHINGLVRSSVHIIHSPYSNYNYVIK